MTPETAEDERPDPGQRIRGDARGIPAVMGDGRTWLIPHAATAPAMDELRNRLYDDVVNSNAVEVLDIKTALLALLPVNYDLSPIEAITLAAGAEPAAVSGPVVEALTGRRQVGARSTRTDWIRSALISNGIRPEDVPGPDLPAVLEQLVATGRAMPCDKFHDVSRQVRARKEVLAQAQW